ALPRWGRGGVYGTRASRRIGLLGGSFNPGHAGHLHISRLALQRLGLDEIWWLVSPQNPLKSAVGMAPFAERLAQARQVAAGERRILVTSLEAELGSTYTADTVKALRRRFPRARFVWLMGGDNLAQIPYWKRWQEIFRTVPIAVFARPGTELTALAGPAARRFARARLPAAAARRLALTKPPAWVFFHTRLDPRSATRIRAGRLKTLKEMRPAVTSHATAVTTLTPCARQVSRAPELLRCIIGSLEDGKAEDIVTIDLAGKTMMADYMVIASGRSARQVLSLTDHLEQAIPGRVAVEGKSQGDWVLLDAGDVIVHLFRPEIRAYYNLEKMWGSDLPDIEAALQ
ncbi:MAG: nicotinate-nucleotide adenylyltransferase, partial [Alphaproteobacteria bacterium]|nr:nicotinate-nucleotide adenylyltransferase [Alphaproteobacteria bacterium]